jgi:MerR family redox-sensitive transcriptional activator SoxR
MSGLRASAIRYYERLGILPAARRTGGQRRYSSDALDHLAVIQFARLTGFTLGEIRQLVRGFPEGTPAPQRWQKLARRKLAEIDRLIARAQGMKQMLEAGLDCRCASLAECGQMIRARMAPRRRR